MQKITLDGFVHKAITPFRIAVTVDENTTPWRFGKSPIFEPFLISLVESFNPEYRIGPFRMAAGVKIKEYVWGKPQITVAGPTTKLTGRVDVNENKMFLHDILEGKQILILDHASIHKFSPPQKIIFNNLSSISDIVRTWASTRPFANSITRGWIDYEYMTCDEIFATLNTAMLLEVPIKDILHQLLVRIRKSGIEKHRQYYEWDAGFKNFRAKDIIFADVLASELGPPPYSPQQLMLA